METSLNGKQDRAELLGWLDVLYALSKKIRPVKIFSENEDMTVLGANELFNKIVEHILNNSWRNINCVGNTAVVRYFVAKVTLAFRDTRHQLPERMRKTTAWWWANKGKNPQHQLLLEHAANLIQSCKWRRLLRRTTGKTAQAYLEHHRPVFFPVDMNGCGMRPRVRAEVLQSDVWVGRHQRIGLGQRRRVKFEYGTGKTEVTLKLSRSRCYKDVGHNLKNYCRLDCCQLSLDCSEGGGEPAISVWGTGLASMLLGDGCVAKTK